MQKTEYKTIDVIGASEFDKVLNLMIDKGWMTMWPPSIYIDSEGKTHFTQQISKIH